MDADLLRKLDPQRFPNVSLPMAATPDGHVLGWPSAEEGVGHSMHLGVEADPRANLSRLGMAAGLDQEGRTRFAVMVRSWLSMELGELTGEGGS